MLDQDLWKWLQLGAVGFVCGLLFYLIRFLLSLLLWLIQRDDR